MESPKDKNKLPKEEIEKKESLPEKEAPKPKMEAKEEPKVEAKEEPEGIVESIKETKDDIVESIQEKKEAITDSIKETKEGISKSIDSGVKKTKSFFKRLLVGAFLLALVAGGIFLLYANWTYSEGTRAGNLIKISKKGYVFKTFEGQLKLGGIDLDNKEEGLSDTWSFSVNDETIYKQLEKLQGEKIILRYKQKNKGMPWQGKTDYFIYAIEKN